MASEATNFGDNRFSLLSPTPRAKRKKPQPSNIITQFPELPVTKKDDPKFVTIKATNQNKNLSSFSIFAVHKALLVICKEINKIIPLPDGSLVLLLRNQANAKKFLDAKTLPGICEITTKYHENLNSVKGTVYAPFLNNVPESEIVEGLKEYNVTNVYKFQRKTDGALKPTGVVLITFDSYHLPDKINIAWVNTSVRPFYPNPMRCKTCQKIGHTQKNCKSLPACVSCNLPPHTPEQCIRNYCANCAGEHAASSNSCPKYKQAKEVLVIKTQEKCSMREAQKIYKSRNPLQLSSPTYANVVSTNNITEQINVKLNTNSSTITKNNSVNQQLPKETKTNTDQQKQHFNNNNISPSTAQNTCLPATETFSTSSTNYKYSSPILSANLTTCEANTKSAMEIDTISQQQTHATEHSRASPMITNRNTATSPKIRTPAEEYSDTPTIHNMDLNLSSLTQQHTHI